MAHEERLLICVDLGRVWTHVAYGFTKTPDTIYDIRNWPGPLGARMPGCPSLIRYKEDNSFEWGFQTLRNTERRLECVKLLSDSQKSNPSHSSTDQQRLELNRLGISASKVAADFLSAMYSHTRACIRGKFPYIEDKLIKKELLLSAPIGCSDESKFEMIRALRQAGIQAVKFVNDSTAAIIFCVKTLSQIELEVGDAVLLCNASEDITDVFAYEVTKLQPLALSEMVVGVGTLGIPPAIARDFEHWLETIVGELAFDELRGRDCYQLAMQIFEDSIIPGFRDAEDGDQYISFPDAGLVDNPSRGLHSDVITVSAETLQEIFEPILQKAVDLISVQVEAVKKYRIFRSHPKGDEIKAIFLIDSWGGRGYLYEYTKYVHATIPIIHHENQPLLAITHGAILSESFTGDIVMLSAAAKHYGVSVRMLYDPARDVGQKPYPDSRGETLYCNNVEWRVRKGDDMLRMGNLNLPVSRFFPAKPNYADMQVTHDIWECDTGNPPRHPDPDTMHKAGTLASDFSLVPVDMFERRTLWNSDGAEIDFWELHYEISTTMQNGTLTFSLVCGEVEYGRTVVSCG